MFKLFITILVSLHFPFVWTQFEMRQFTSNTITSCQVQEFFFLCVTEICQWNFSISELWKISSKVSKRLSVMVHRTKIRIHKHFINKLLSRSYEIISRLKIKKLWQKFYEIISRRKLKTLWQKLFEIIGRRWIKNFVAKSSKK